MPELARFGSGSNAFWRVGACRDSRRSAPANGPPIEAASHSVEPLHNRQANIDIAAGGIGIGAYLVRLLHQRLCLGAWNPWQGNVELDV